jgi:hypothetical protein
VTAPPEPPPGPTEHLGAVPGPLRILLRLLTTHEEPAGAVYGTVIVGSLLAAESAHVEDLLRSVSAVLIAMVVFWFAHAYANGMARRIERNQPFSLHDFTGSLVLEWNVLRGAIVPILAVIVAGLAGASNTVALEVGLYVSAAALVAFEVVAGLRVGARGRQLLTQAAAGGVLGLGIIALHTVLA